jgi:Fic family protein
MPFDRTQPFNDLPDLPPAAQLETPTVLKQAIASARALERLRGTSARLPNPRVLVSGIVLQEARLSSEVENIVTTNDELYRAAAGSSDGVIDPATKEVLRYREALWFGFEQLAKRPLTTNLFIELVGLVRQTEVGLRNTAGTTLKSSTGEVIYTPPEGEALLRSKLANFEAYIHEEREVDPLIMLAVLHYQFEAIHPFTDGNGRTGRILNILFLVQRGLLDLPVLYLSHYILRNKIQYYTGLRLVTEEAKWEAWVLFMLQGIEQTSNETCLLIDQLLKQIENVSTMFRLQYPSSYSKDLMEVIFSNPYCRIRFVEEQLQVTRQTASSYLQKLTELGFLREVRIGRDVYFVNDSMLATLSPKP